MIDPGITGETAMGTPAWWDARYQSGDAPWDTGIVPPEVRALVESLPAPGKGWALDLGCGPGVTSRYLAENGYRVVGVDLAFSALSRACRAAQEAKLSTYFCLADVSDLAYLNIQAELAVDIGCFHAIPPERRRAYIASLAAHLTPKAPYLLYAFEPGPYESGPTGIGPIEIAAFAPHFTLRRAQHGRDGERASAWYLFQRAPLVE